MHLSRRMCNIKFLHLPVLIIGRVKGKPFNHMLHCWRSLKTYTCIITLALSQMVFDGRNHLNDWCFLLVSLAKFYVSGLNLSRMWLRSIQPILYNVRNWQIKFRLIRNYFFQNPIPTFGHSPAYLHTNVWLCSIMQNLMLATVCEEAWQETPQLNNIVTHNWTLMCINYWGWWWQVFWDIILLGCIYCLWLMTSIFRKYVSFVCVLCKRTNIWGVSQMQYHII